MTRRAMADDQCVAMLKYIWKARCSRKAYMHGLCKQHLSVQCVVPAGWTDGFTPLPPYEQWQP